MLKRTYVVLPFLVALVVLLAACGGGATATTAPTETIHNPRSRLGTKLPAKP